MDLVHISVPNALLTALLGYGVVFLGLVMLMAVLLIMGRITVRNSAAPVSSAEKAVSPAPAPPAEKAPGTAGELKLYGTDPRDAAMIMAIVADTLGKPLNELRFISIREVTDDEV